MKASSYILYAIMRRKYRSMKHSFEHPGIYQDRILQDIITKGKKTRFGHEHGFAQIRNYDDYKQAVPIRPYAELKHYIDAIIAGEKDVLWPGIPMFFAKSSGTTSGTKYLPVTKESLQNHLSAAKNQTACYVSHKKNADFLLGKTVFFADSPIFEMVGGIRAGAISSIKTFCIPRVYSSFLIPDRKVNSIANYDDKIEALVRQSIGQDVRSIIGMPPWLMLYLRELKAKTGKTMKENFPNFNMLVSSGMNYEPYLPMMKEYIGGDFDLLDSYPASEGVFAYHEYAGQVGMQMHLNAGIFYEFVPVSELSKAEPARFKLEQVETGVNYAFVLNTNAGLMGYLLGDTVRFVSTRPYKLIVSGRISQYISAFGEHMLAEEAEKAISETAIEYGASIAEFTVSPYFPEQKDKIPYHKWMVEFEKAPASVQDFATALDKRICKSNMCYADLIDGRALMPLEIQVLRKDSFVEYKKQNNKTGSQVKIPHVSNDDAFARQLIPFLEDVK